MSEIDALLKEERLFPPKAESRTTANVSDPSVYGRAAADPEGFWADFAFANVLRSFGLKRGDRVALPKTRSGKIMHRLLRDIAEGKTLGDTTTLADPAVVARLKSEYEEKEG
jgi:hypothetical protein